MTKPYYYLNIEKLRKEQICIVCSDIIPKGSYALKERGYNEYDKYFLNYIHLDKERGCYDHYIDVQQRKMMKMILEGVEMVNVNG